MEVEGLWMAQAPPFVGLISMVTGSTLQEDIAATTRQVLLRGRNIPGFLPAIPAGPRSGSHRLL